MDGPVRTHNPDSLHQPVKAQSPTRFPWGAHPPLNRSLGVGVGGAVAAVPAPAHPGAGLP